MELIVIIAVVVVFVAMRRQNDRLKRLETEFATFRASAGLALPAAAQAVAPSTDPQQAETAHDVEQVTEEGEGGEQAAGPWSAPSPEPAAEAPEAPEPAAKPARPDIETALGTRWTVWVGGIALALGGVFLVRYSIEAGIFGPGVRLTFAALFGLALAAAGEIARRRGFDAPIGGVKGAYVPAILTAAASFTLFGAAYAAHGVYGFLGPVAAFFLLGLIGLATLGAALVHGQALAGLGLLGSYLTPVLIASTAPSPWTLFLYLTVVLVAAVSVASIRNWRFLSNGAYVGAGIWSVIYLVAESGPILAPVVLLQLAGLAVLALIWLAWREEGRKPDSTPATAAFFAVFVAAIFGMLPDFDGGAPMAALLIAAVAAIPVWRERGTVPMLHLAGAALVAIVGQGLLASDIAVDLGTRGVTLDGMWVSPELDAFMPYAYGLAVMFLAGGIAVCWISVAKRPRRAAAFAFWAVAVPLATLVSAWMSFGDLEIDRGYAAAALILAAVLAVAGELVARAEAQPQRGGAPVSILLVGAAAFLALALMMAFGPLLTTILTGLAAALPAALTRSRAYPVLGWLSAAFAALTLVRIGIDPTLVGAHALSATPVFNALLPGYLVPAAAFAYAAWQLARTTDGKPRLAMEAFAALFALLGVAMLVRHAMNGGVIDAGEPTLAEQAIYTLMAIGAGGILLALDRRSPSPVFRWGSIGAGVVSTLLIASAHFIGLNPLFTNESTGTIPVLNLVLLAYLLPAAAMAALAWYARGRRPRWYVGMLAACASALAFVYVSLSIRRIFQGEFIGGWKGMDGLETYTYSAVWLALGVAILIAGVRLGSRILRLVSALLVVLAVAKVFLFDMSELEGVLRALSFIGLGGVLIGIGMFYQRMLVSAAR